MAGDFILDSADAPPARFDKVLKVFIVIAVFCLAFELVWLLGVSPFRPFSRIDISGSDLYSREEILAAGGISGKSSFISTDAKAVEKALMGVSSFESVRVFKYFPGRLKIIIENRRPVASALALVDGKMSPVMFDSHGVIFEIGVHGAALPVVSGLVIEDPFPGMKLPPLFIPFLTELDRIGRTSPELLSVVSELRIQRKPFDGFDLVMYPVHRKIKVRLSELNEDMLRYALLMVDVLASRDDGIDTLDFRSGIASYITKETTP